MAMNLVVAVLDRGPSGLADMAVLLAIADSADRDTGEAWPSQATIAKRSRQTERSVRNVLERLRADGWLTWQERRRANGSRTSNVYTLNLAKLGEARGPEPQADPQPERRSGRARATGTTFRGAPEPRSGHAPERRSAPEPSKKEPNAREAGGAQRRARRSPLDSGGGPDAEAVAELGAFQRARLRQGASVLIGGQLVAAGSPGFAEWASALAEVERGPQAGSLLAATAAAAEGCGHAEKGARP